MSVSSFADDCHRGVSIARVYQIELTRHAIAARETFNLRRPHRCSRSGEPKESIYNFDLADMVQTNLGSNTRRKIVVATPLKTYGAIRDACALLGPTKHVVCHSSSEPQGCGECERASLNSM